MKHAPLAVGLALALTAPLSGAAQAAPPEPARPAYVLPNDLQYCAPYDVDWREGDGRVLDMDQSDADDSLAVGVLDRKWLVLSYFDGGDCTWYRWYNTRRGSTFYLNFCDQHGDGYIDRVSRKQFLDRVGSTRESHVLFRYDRERDRGAFSVRTDWENEPCEVRAR